MAALLALPVSASAQDPAVVNLDATVVQGRVHRPLVVFLGPPADVYRRVERARPGDAPAPAPRPNAHSTR